MKFTISKADIVDVLSKVQGLTGRKSNLAITECILIRTMENGIRLSATDLETGFEGTYPANIQAPGSIAVNARKFFEIVREFPSQDILVNEIENRWIEIGNPNVQFHIVGMNPDDFPDSPYVAEVDLYEIDSEALRKMIERSVLISGSGDDKRAHINGVYLESIQRDGKPSVRMVSTDGSRLSTVDYLFENGTYLPAGESILIPKKGLNEVSKFLDAPGKVQMGVKGSYFVVKKETEIIIIRLLEGSFPKYEEILQKDQHFSIKINKNLFSKMLKRMSILSSENYKGAIFSFKPQQLEITATNPDIGESKEDMQIDYEGDRIEAAFNTRFFIESLNAMEDEEVLIFILNEEKPCLIEGMVDKSYLSVIMPMRI
jgi:DNA polymerase III subunit beta